MIALLNNLKTYLPFSLLDNKAFKRIEESAQIAYYPENTVLIEENEIPSTFFLIIKGIVESKDGEELIDIYHNDDVFGGIELIKNQPSAYQYKVNEELICYEIPKEVFLELCQKNSEFKNYFFSSIVERMDMLKERKESAKMADMMLTRVDDSILHSACIVDHTMPIIDAITKMENESAVALLVKNESGYGIVTDADLREYILHHEEKNLTIISQIQTYPIISVTEGELLFNVLLLMTGRSIKHLPVLNAEEEVIGLLELIDLLSHFANQSHIIHVQIEKATDLQSVIDASKRIDTMIKTLHLKGVKSRYIARLVSEMHKKMYAKLFELIFPHEWHDRCTLILLGSEGRGEQILKTDQDNGLIFEEGFEPKDQVEITLKFTETLDAIGFPRCKGNVMVINPKWAKSTTKYKEDIRRWITSPGNDDLMDMAIFFDTFAVAGKISIFKDLRDFLMEQIKQHKAFLPHFARSIESFESPLGLFSRFVSSDKGHKDEIDIKKGALFALIHGVRALALEHGIHKTNTTERIKALNDIGYMSKEDAGDLLETLEVINTLRLHSQLEKLEKEKEIDNYICLSTLSKLERDTLKEALKTVEEFKKVVSYHFHLSMVG
ncbi:putative nucleotidyltransferase substrate binding domain-containing protein [Sulfurovum sp. CS9]|uniref:putative nucleotidyltransferase substrate binding domain-containing protein n=1 Tax=Sulfurovum sp. CS9 TaxID=3391146 RepID=UPI0039E98876